MIQNHRFLKERRIGVDRARVNQSGIGGVPSERKDLVGMVLRAVPCAGMGLPVRAGEDRRGRLGGAKRPLREFTSLAALSTFHRA